LGVVSNRFSISSDKELSFFSVAPGGRIVWENGSATCDRCGCAVATGKRNDEPAADLKARLKGKRAKCIQGRVACAGCGHEYKAHPEEIPDWK
jgi:hypothetical protein